MTPTAATMAPPAVKRQKVAHDALFPAQYLSFPVIRQILDFLDLPSLVQAAGCNQAWRMEVFGDHHVHLWSVIAFAAYRPGEPNNGGEDEKKKAARLTDDQLEALLRNSRAVERCKVLKLYGCLNVTGRGLEPLRGSKVLQDIDLRLVMPGEMQTAAKETNTAPAWPHPKVDSTVVLPILSSIVSASTSPFSPPCSNKPSVGLSLVKFDMVNEADHYYTRFSTEVGDWLFEFHQALRQKAAQNHTACGYCRGDMLEGKTEDCKIWIMSSAYCEICEKYSCGEGTCPSTWFCQECLVQSCQPMGPASQGQCPNHKMVYSCKACDRMQCEDCFDGFMCANDDCCNEYCSDETKDCLEALESCDICQSDKEYKFYCPECIDDHVRYCRGPTSTNKKKPAEK